MDHGWLSFSASKPGFGCFMLCARFDAMLKLLYHFILWEYTVAMEGKAECVNEW